MSVTAAFDVSYRRLEESQARVFRLMAVNPGPDASTVTVAIIADLQVTEARKVLAGLARAHLVEAAPGMAVRWKMHDLVRRTLSGCQTIMRRPIDKTRPVTGCSATTWAPPQPPMTRFGCCRG